MTSITTLTLLNGSAANQTFTYNRAAKVTIGRGEDCTIVIPHDDISRLVSRKHCEIAIDPPQTTIRDLGSANGTYLTRQNNKIPIGRNGQPNNAHALQNGDVIEVDAIKIAVVINHSVQPASTPTSAPVTPPQKPSQPQRPIAPTALRPNARRGRSLPRKVWDDNQGKLRNLANNEVIGQILPWVKAFNDQDANLPEGFRNYKIESSLGKGQYGEVFLAHNTAEDQEVALKKMFERDMNNPEMLARFKREIGNLEWLEHPNIVRFLNSDIYQNNFIYTMEYCELGDLKQLVEYMGGTLPLDIAKMMISQVLDGLIYLHERAAIRVRTKEGNVTVNTLVHRDLKPSNILLRNDGIRLVAKISDFGLSKALGIDPNLAIPLTQTVKDTQGLGTREFMCRRQLQNFRDSGPEVDVWSAVACLYYMLTGYPPRDFDKSGLPETIVINNDPVPILERNPHINSQLAQFIDAALKEDPNNHNAFKYQTAASLQQALLKVLP